MVKFHGTQLMRSWNLCVPNGQNYPTPTHTQTPHLLCFTERGNLHSIAQVTAVILSVYSSAYKVVRTNLLTHKFYTKITLHSCSIYIGMVFQEEMQRHWLLCWLVTCTSILWNDAEHSPSSLLWFNPSRQLSTMQLLPPPPSPVGRRKKKVKLVGWDKNSLITKVK